jgi:CRP-like cAMP-binding protein
MTEKDILDIFKSNGILTAADEENIKKYIFPSATRLCCFKAGDVIYSPKSRKKRIGIVISGKVIASSETTLLKIIPPNDIFGIANLYSKDVFPSTITARSEARVLLIDEAAFKALIENDAKLLNSYLCFMSNKIVYLNKKICSLTAGNTAKKLAAFLLDNQCDGTYSLPASISALADMLNVGRASLYRAMDVLVDEGLIERKGKTILILDKNSLFKFI